MDIYTENTDTENTKYIDNFIYEIDKCKEINSLPKRTTITQQAYRLAYFL